MMYCTEERRIIRLIAYSPYTIQSEVMSTSHIS